MTGARQELHLPKFNYYLDESDPDIVILCRQDDDALVAAFSARGATTEGLVEAAKQDYEVLLRQNAGALGLAAEEHRSALPANAWSYSPECMEQEFSEVRS